MSDNEKDKQAKADIHNLTESYLKGKQKEDPTITEADKQEFRNLMDEVADHATGKSKKK